VGAQPLHPAAAPELLAAGTRLDPWRLSLIAFGALPIVGVIVNVVPL